MQKAEGTMHCDLLGVLDEAAAPSNLHGDSVHPLHSERVRDAALQGDEGLEEANTKDEIRVRLTQDHNMHLNYPPGNNSPAP